MDPLAGSAAAPLLDAAGLNVRGCLSAARYDERVPAAWRAARLCPGARSAVVVGNGGPAHFRAFRAAPEARGRRDPLDRFTRRVVLEAAGALAEGSVPLLYAERRGGRFADFVALGEAAGLGAPSRLGLLLHPEYGPWLAIRALVLTPLALPETRPLAGFAPCEGCPAPCAAACPGAAVPASGFDAGACARTRAALPACRARCAARNACVVGPEHAYGPEAEAHHMAAVAFR